MRATKTRNKRRSLRPQMLEQLEGRRVLTTVVDIEFNTDFVHPAPPPHSSGQAPNTWQSQRSDLRTIDIVLDRFIDTNDVDHTDVVLTNLGLQPTSQPTIVNLEPDNFILLADQQSLTHTIRLQFDKHELDDGRYHITLLPDDIHGAFDGVGLDGNGDGTTGDSFEACTTHRLLADFNGDNGVSVFDFGDLGYWFDTNDPDFYVDLNEDGGVTAFDFTQFGQQFGLTVSPSCVREPLEVAFGTPTVLENVANGTLLSAAAPQGVASIVAGQLHFDPGFDLVPGDEVSIDVAVQVPTGAVETITVDVVIVVGTAPPNRPIGIMWLNTEASPQDGTTELTGTHTNPRKVNEGVDGAFRRMVVVAVDSLKATQDHEFVPVEIPPGEMDAYFTIDGQSSSGPNMTNADFQFPNLTGHGPYRMSPGTSTFEWFVPCTIVENVATPAEPVEEYLMTLNPMGILTEIFGNIPGHSGRQYYTELYDSSVNVENDAISGSSSPTDHAVNGGGDPCQANVSNYP